MSIVTFDDVLDECITCTTACCHNASVCKNYHSIIMPNYHCKYYAQYFEHFEHNGKTAVAVVQEDKNLGYLEHLETKVKRPRRKAADMIRVYGCDFCGCYKSYEKLSHLNTHRKGKNHGVNLSQSDF